jgi:hypothetical protein
MNAIRRQTPDHLRAPAGALERSALRSVALPAEHGGWSLTLEPALLGLVVVSGPAGVLLTVVALLAFMARAPLKRSIGDRLRRRRLARTRLADRVAAAYLLAGAAAGWGAAALADGPFWIPLAAASPLFLTQLWYDVRARSRRLVPELAGTVGIGSVAAAVVVAGGGSPADAGAVWLIAAARAVAAIPYVRLQLRRAKGRPSTLRSSDAAQVAAMTATAFGMGFGIVPVAAGAAVGGLVAVHTITARLAPPRAPVLGAQQAVLGLALVVIAGLAIAPP